MTVKCSSYVFLFTFLFVEVDDEDVFKDYEVEQFSKYDDYQKRSEEEFEQGYATLGHTPSARVSTISYNAYNSRQNS